MRCDPERKFNGERAFIAAILAQAFNDAISWESSSRPRQAREFIDSNNKLFCWYCELLNFNPEYVARKMQERLRQNDLHSLSRLRL
jgi:hypothetical protein